MITVEWCEPVDGPALRDLLDADEVARVQRLVRPEDRARFVTGRALLRTAAAAVVGGEPRAVVVRVRCARCGGPHGKPAVDGLEASIAHSGDRVVLAWRKRGAVGVDVEGRRPGRVLADLADQVHAPGERSDDLLLTWARKEAVLKLRGVGLTEPMTGVRLDDPGVRVTDLDLGAGYVAAVAAHDTAPVTVRRSRP
ncbi:4'-phosphopantetheinyl transferase family protein [Nocardioides dongxiaopingii]|uniref:4'-phosphopantetheinyl transferase family protein n=1 Tax=Nocardioides dongxiaopingii TaxID=2576036 RepID=UPI0010C764F6|nr:4'-phosphopantetheinyl transferase superfamily protein [Nocardioides dongxiaopingii]